MLPLKIINLALSPYMEIFLYWVRINISFTHSPFWVQVWGLPFENMFEEVGRDLGNRLGKYKETDKRSWLSEQAKFMRVHVDLPIDKPL